MKKSLPASARNPASEVDYFFAQAEAAMRRASRQVAAENKRLGFPLIVDKLPRLAPKLPK